MWGEPIAKGKAKRDPSLGELQVYASPALAIGDDVDHMLDWVRPSLALYIGGMGAKGKNFYNDLAVRYGYEEAAEKIQDLYLAGKKDEAAAAVPDELVRAVSLIGSRELRQGTRRSLRRSRCHDAQRHGRWRPTATAECS